MLAHAVVWLTLDQMAELFGRDKSVISRHLKNVFASGELERSSVVAKYATLAADSKTYEVSYFSLDAILSVGYRVNSKRGTQFRIWATRTLRDHLVRGYTLNERRLQERGVDIQQAVSLLSHTLTTHAMATSEGKAILDVVGRYTRTWQLLPQYDNGELAEAPCQPVRPTQQLGVQPARTLIARLRTTLSAAGESVALFGRERTEHLEGILAAIEQTFDQRPLYPSVQARAAHLFYFVIKDHPFADGNKRIGSAALCRTTRTGQQPRDSWCTRPGLGTGETHTLVAGSACGCLAPTSFFQRTRATIALIQ